MIKFGTGGWRAIIADGFTKLNIQKLAAALSQKMKDEGAAPKGIVVGYDRRFLSNLASRWLCEVFAAAGVNCYYIRHEAPTPLVMFAVKEYDVKYGAAITASHNPAEYNGVKIFTEGGRDADETVTNSIEAYLEKLEENGEIPTIDFDEAVRRGVVSLINPNNKYVDSILRVINTDAIRGKELKLAVDPMYGVSKTSLVTILTTARAEVDVIHERRDALFGGRLPAPAEETLKTLTAFVLERGCNLGIATDGDADRIGVIDDLGNFIHPNKILALLYYYLLKYKHWRGPVVRNLCTTRLLDVIAEANGEVAYETPVGFKNISSKMAETNALIGGESSGGMTVRGHIMGKDGIYAAALLTEMIAVTNKNISRIYKEITEEFGEFFMVERNYSLEKRFSLEDIFSEADKELNTGINKEFGKERKNILRRDGIKINFADGDWVTARFSGTEPLLRVFAESGTVAEAENLAETMKKIIEPK
jgi:phosphomannomutase